jgi:hypothetical protein
MDSRNGRSKTASFQRENPWPGIAEEFMKRFNQLLFNNSILEYNGGKKWYDVHPVIQQIAAFQEAKADVESQAKSQAAK